MKKFQQIIILICLFLILPIFAFTASFQSGRVLLVVADEGFDEMQFVMFKAKLDDAGFKVDVVNLNGKFSSGNGGLKIQSDIKLKDAVAADYISILITDGNDLPALKKNTDLKSLCQSFSVSGKIIGAIGNAPVILSEFSLLKNRKATCWPASSGELKSSGADYTGKIVETSGNLITGMGGSDENIMVFVNQYAELINGKESAKKNLQFELKNSIPFRYYEKEKRFVMTHNNRVRTGTVYVPESYDKKKSYSLVFVLHGTGGKGVDMYNKGFNQYADDLNFIVIYPDGYNGDWDILPGRKTVFDDQGFFRSLISSFSRMYNVDSKRIYFTGHSLGAFMTYSLAYDMPDLITAIAPVSGVVYIPQIEESKHTSISILHQHALDDYNVTFANETPFPEPLGVMDSLKYWRNLNEMESTEKKFTIRKGMDAVLWNGKDGKTDVELIKYETGGHAWPSLATTEICSFFYNHPPRENKIDISSAQTHGYYDKSTQIRIPVAVQNKDRIKKIRYFANGKPAGDDVRSPFICELKNYPEGVYRITAEAELSDGNRIFSGNSVQFVITQPDIARNCSVKSSSDESEVNAAENITDGDQYTRWSSLYTDDQWIQIDLGKTGKISGAVLIWETAFASAYSIQVSSDARKWKTVYSTEKGSGGTEKISFSPVSGRYIRMLGIKRETQWGYSLWDFIVTGK